MDRCNHLSKIIKFQFIINLEIIFILIFSSSYNRNDSFLFCLFSTVTLFGFLEDICFHGDGIEMWSVVALRASAVHAAGTQLSLEILGAELLLLRGVNMQDLCGNEVSNNARIKTNP